MKGSALCSSFFFLFLLCFFFPWTSGPVQTRTASGLRGNSASRPEPALASLPVGHYRGNAKQQEQLEEEEEGEEEDQQPPAQRLVGPWDCEAALLWRWDEGGAV